MGLHERPVDIANPHDHRPRSPIRDLVLGNVGQADMRVRLSRIVMVTIEAILIVDPRLAVERVEEVEGTGNLQKVAGGNSSSGPTVLDQVCPAKNQSPRSLRSPQACRPHGPWLPAEADRYAVRRPRFIGCGGSKPPRGNQWPGIRASQFQK